jgi:hypothetical protein
MNNTINGINAYKLGEMNKEFKRQYLKECLQLIDDGEFKENAIAIANRCVHIDSTLYTIDSVIIESDENDGIDIEDLQDFKNEGYDYVDGDFEPRSFKNDSEIIIYALANLY